MWNFNPRNFNPKNKFFVKIFLFAKGQQRSKYFITTNLDFTNRPHPQFRVSNSLLSHRRRADQSAAVSDLREIQKNQILFYSQSKIKMIPVLWDKKQKRQNTGKEKINLWTLPWFIYHWFNPPVLTWTLMHQFTVDFEQLNGKKSWCILSYPFFIFTAKNYWRISILDLEFKKLIRSRDL